MTAETPDREFVAELSKTVVTQVAPEELDMFDELLSDYFENPKPPDLTARSQDASLGFGLGDVIIAVTPAAAAVASAVFAFIVNTLQQAAQNEGAEQIQKRLKERLSGKAKTVGPLLNQAQLEQLKQVTMATAEKYGMNATQSEQLTNAILVSLVLGTMPGEPPRHVKILFLAANPSDLETLQLDEEIRNIDHALRGGEFRDLFEIEQHWAVRVSDVQELLLRHHPDIVHFSGHGSNKSTLLFEGTDGRLDSAPTAAFADLFRVLKDNVRCVVLNACYSQVEAEAIAQYVECVIYMSDAIDDTSAIQFSFAFYQALAYGRDVQTAFELGLSYIQLERGAGAKIPQLLVKTEAARGLHFVQESVTRPSSQNNSK